MLQILLLFPAFAWAGEQSTRNADLNRWIARDRPECVTVLYSGDKSCIEWLFVNAFGLAGESRPVDNRPYLFALAIDLYNAMPASAPYAAGCEEGDPCPGQEKAYYRPITDSPMSERRNLWEFILRHPEETSKEPPYLWEYLRTHIKLDSFDAPPSLNAADLDLQNPTHYAELKRWMAETETARAEGVPPWEAIKRFPAPAEGATPEAAATDTAPATSQAPPKPESPKPTQDERFDSDATGAKQAPAKPSEYTTPPRPWWIAAAVVLLVLAAAWYLRRRNRA